MEKYTVAMVYCRVIQKKAKEMLPETPETTKFTQWLREQIFMLLDKIIDHKLI